MHRKLLRLLAFEKFRMVSKQTNVRVVALTIRLELKYLNSEDKLEKFALLEQCD